MSLRRFAAAMRTIPVVRRVIPVVHRVLGTRRYVRTRTRPASPLPGAAATRPPKTAPRPRAVANLRVVRWVDPGVLELRGWAYLDGVPSDSVELEVVAQSPAGQRLTFQIDDTPVDEANLVAKDPLLDRREAAFTARLDLVAEARTFPVVNFEQIWAVSVVVLSRRDDATAPRLELARTPFTTYFKLGSAQLSRAENIGEDLLVRPLWRGGRGLVVVVARRAAVLAEIDLADGRLRFSVATSRFAVVRAKIKQDPAESISLTPLESSSAGSESARQSFEVDLADLDPARRGSAYVMVTNGAGSTRYVHWNRSNRATVLTDPRHPDLRVICAPSGVVRIDQVSLRVEVTAATVDETAAVPVLVLTGRSVGVADLTLELRGPREVLRPTSISHDGAPPLVGFVARFPLAQRHQGQTRVNAIRQGVYRLVAVDAESEVIAQVVVATELGEQLAMRIHLDSVHLRLERSTGGVFQVRAEAPKRDAEHGAINQARHVAAFRASGHEMVDCVYFESFNGRSVGDNTLAIANEVATRHPDLSVYWAVADHSVETPEGATPLLIHSARWWDLLARARYVVSNNWLAGASVRRRYQTVLQAWHGTPLKTLGIDRFGADDPGKVAHMRKMSSIWDLFISQNPYSTDIFRRCYVYDGPMLEIGYPRNDVLTTGLGEDAMTDLRTALGLRTGQRVALYMPTWREDTRQLFAELHFDQLTAGIGEDWVLLVRGHTNTQNHGRTVSAATVVDVTMYPDPAALYLLADVLITDYSSVMFDYSITGKPMIFFTPDLERYETSLRGTYFSLPDRAPGPLLSTTAEVVEAVRALDQIQTSYAAKYATWRADFNPWDDGRAAHRAADALLGHQP